MTKPIKISLIAGLIVLVAAVGFFIFYFRQKISLLNNFDNFFPNSNQVILLLGQPGLEQYQTDYNTDAIILVYIDTKTESANFIRIPRDLIVEINKRQYKINSLYALGLKKELLEKISDISGFKVSHYVVFDLSLVKEIVDAIGGIDVDLKEPATDWASGFTLAPGVHHLDGKLAEFVIRDRFYPTGDFYRIHNQFLVFQAIKEKIEELPKTKLIGLIGIIQASRRHYETNLEEYQILDFLTKIEKIKSDRFHDIIIDTNHNLLQAGSFRIYFGQIYYDNIYGLIPPFGINHYAEIRNFINDQINQSKQNSNEASST